MNFELSHDLPRGTLTINVVLHHYFSSLHLSVQFCVVSSLFRFILKHKESYSSCRLT